MSLLLPSLRQAKEKAKRIVCASNLHQLSVTIISNAVDNDSKFFSADSSIVHQKFNDVEALGLSGSKEITNCPNYSKDLPTYSEGYNSGGRTMLGYLYTGGLSDAVVGSFSGSGNSWSSPKYLYDSPELVLMGDRSSEPQSPWKVRTTHSKIGWREGTNTTVEELGMQGTNVNYLDGSVLWVLYNECQAYNGTVGGNALYFW